MHLTVSPRTSIPAIGNHPSAVEHQLLAKEIPIKAEGFLYIYPDILIFIGTGCANESSYPEISGGVWFDDFTVEVTKSKVAAVSDYCIYRLSKSPIKIYSGINFKSSPNSLSVRFSF